MLTAGVAEIAPWDSNLAINYNAAYDFSLSLSGAVSAKKRGFRG